MSPTVLRVAAVLEQRIQLGTYPEGHWLPAERDLAQQLGVGRGIVRLALDELEMRQLIQRAPYCRPLVQKTDAFELYESIRAVRNAVLVGFWADWDELNWTALQTGILKGLDTAYYHLIVEQPRIEKIARRFSLEQAVREPRIAGILLCAFHRMDVLPVPQVVLNTGIPIVFVGLPPPEGIEADFVGTNDKSAAEAVVGHLIVQGHRSIAHLTRFETGESERERLIGYRQALEGAAIPFRPELVVAYSSDDQGRMLIHADMLRRLLSLPDPPTAVFAVNDILALYAINAIRECSLRVPQDMAVAGFGGYLPRETDRALLTTAIQPWERIGQEAAELLVGRMKFGSPAHYQHILLDAPIRISDSTLLPARASAEPGRNVVKRPLHTPEEEKRS